MLAQVISFLVMPVITRLHTPDSLGHYQFFTTLALVISPFVTGSLHFAIKSSPSKYRALKNLKLAMQFSLACSLLFLIFVPVVMLILAGTSLEWFSVYTPLLVLFVYLTANYQFAMAYLTNIKNYGMQSTYSVSKSLISNFLKLTFSFFSRTGFSLIFALILTELFQVLWLLKNSHKSLLRSFFRLKLSVFTKQLSSLRRYPTYVTMTSVLGILMNWFPILVTGMFYGPEHVGVLGLAFMVVNTPVYPFISALRSVCFGELARDFSFSRCVSVYRKSFLVAFFPSVLGVLVLGSYGEELFSIIFGSEWRISGNYAFICFFPIALSLLLSPIYSTLNHFFGFQRLFFLINLLVFIIGLTLTSTFGYLGFDFEWFLICFAITMSINHLLLFVISLSLAFGKISLKRL